MMAAEPNGRCGFGVLGLFGLLVSCLAGARGAAQPPADSSAAPADAAAYLLIIDHSGSMMERAASGRTRWEEMQTRAVEFVRNVRPGSRIWLGVFSGNKPRPEICTLHTQQDRNALIQRIERGYGRPQGGTALYDTLGMAFEEAERLSQQNPNRYISVMVYTDGKDEGSREWTRDALQKRFKQLIDQNKNLWLFFTPLDKIPPVLDPAQGGERIEMGQPKIPISLRLLTDSLVLKSPRVQPRPTIQIEFLASDADWRLLGGKPLSIAFEPVAGQSIVVRPMAAAYPLRSGKMDVALEIPNADSLPGDQEYAGTLRLTFPELDRHTVQAARTIRLAFQRNAPPKIFDFRPADGSTFAAGKPINFWVSTLQGTKILWDFGDGSSDTGEKVTHIYNTPGKRKVTLRVEADPVTGASTRELSLDIIDVGVSIDPIPSPLLEGAALKLTCAGRGDIQRYEWIIDGQKFEGRKIGSGAQTTSELSYTFDRSGRHVVSVVGYAEKAVVQSDERAFDVIRLLLAIVRPQADATLYYGEKNTFRAHVDGPINEVVWTIRAQPKSPGAAAEVLHQVTRPVTATPEGRFAEFEHAFAEAPGMQDLTVEATARLAETVKVAAPAQQIAVHVAHAAIAATLEVEERPYTFNEPVQFRLVAPKGFEGVAWDFGDGTSDSDTPNPIHRYQKYGAFRVTAKVRGKGDQTVTREATVNVIRRAPQAQPKVTVGGKHVDTLQVGSTVELADESTGDVVQRAWALDGSPIAPGQLSVVLDQPGEHKLTLRVAGPDGSGDEKTVLLVVQRKRDHVLFALSAVGATALFALAWRIFSRNEPRAWRVLYAQSPDDFQDFKRVRVGDHWSYWYKRAEIPLGKMFRQCEHWKNGDGKRDVILVGAPTPEGNISYPNRKHAQVNWATIPGTGQDKVYTLTDSRADDPYRQVFFRLQRTVTVSVRDALVRAVIFVALSGVIWYVWQFVYRSR
jgi:PKD repeat protein